MIIFVKCINKIVSSIFNGIPITLEARTKMTFDEFKKYFYEWYDEARYYSSPTMINNHPNREKIITAKNRDDIIGFTCLMFEQDKGTHEIISLLYEMVPKEKQPVINEYYYGRIPVIVECWKYWALKNNIVTIKYNPEKYWVEDKYGNKADWY